MSYAKGDEDVLTDLQELAAAKLRARASIVAAQMPVLTQRQGNLSMLADAQEHQARCILLFPPEPTVSAPNVPGPYFDSVVLTFRIVQTPEFLAADAKGSLYWAMEIYQEFHLSKLADPDFSCAFYAMPGIPNPVAIDHPRKNIFDLLLVTHFGLEAITPA